MKANKILSLFLFLALFASCSADKKIQPSLASKIQDTKSSQRNVASILNSFQPKQDESCFKDNFNTKFLAEQIKTLEENFGKVRVSGSWRHLSLKDLPPPQALFLKKFGKSIGDQRDPDSINYNHCQDLICIFNTIYGEREDYIAGYVHYLWYLKFKNYLSLDNKVPDQKSPTPGIYEDREYDLKEYLYNETELYVFWRITFLLNDHYTNLTNLDEIQRIPRGASHEGYGGLVCGLASSVGNIRLSDGCLATSYLNDNSGFAYLGIIHELTHMLDYLEGRKAGYGLFYRSHKKDYLEVAGFRQVQYMDENGKLVSEWEQYGGAKSVRDYASSSPAESFADTLAYFRQEGENTKKKITPELYNWFSKNYYNNQTFDYEGNQTRLLSKLRLETLDFIYPTLQNCFEADSAEEFSSCIEIEKKLLIEISLQSLKANDVDACPTFADRNTLANWKEDADIFLQDKFDFYITETQNDPDYLNKIATLQEDFSTTAIAHEAFFNCYNDNDREKAEECYDKKIISLSKDVTRLVNVPSYQLEKFSNDYREMHPYQKIYNELFSTYQILLASMDDMIEYESTEIWNSCASKTSDRDTPIGSLFIPENGYLISSIFNCINNNIPRSITKLIKSIDVDGEKIQHPKEEVILRNLILPTVSLYLNDLYSESKTHELQEIRDFVVKKSKKFEEGLIKNKSWLKSLEYRSDMVRDCRTKISASLSFEPRFHIKKDIDLSKETSSICDSILNNPSMKKHVEDSKKQLEEELHRNVRDLLYDKGDVRAKYCRDFIPWKWKRGEWLVYIPRSICLNFGWPKVKDAVIEEAQELPTAKKFNVSKYQVVDKIREFEEEVKQELKDQNF